MKRKRLRKKAAQQPGVALELLVARIQQMMEPNSTVTHNEWIVDRFGIKRQFDVVVRGKYAGRDILGVIECKDHGRKKGPDAIEAFAKKAENVNAHFKCIVSRKGFSKKGLSLARKEGVGCLSVLANDPMQGGFGIGDFWYGIIKTWGMVSLRVECPASQHVNEFKIEDVKLNGLPVINWFFNEFSSRFGDVEENETRTLNVTFRQVRQIQICGTDVNVVGIAVTAVRVFKKKRTWFAWTGDAFYDWHSNTCKVPPKTSLVTSAVETDMLTWDDFEGHIPAGSLLMLGVRNCADAVQIPDLGSLGRCDESAGF